MKVAQITGVTEKNGIIVSKGCQVISIQDMTGALTTEKIEISLVDFETGNETPLFRKDLVILYGEITAQGGNLRIEDIALIEVSDGRNLELNANKVLKIDLTGLNALHSYDVRAIESEAKGGSAVKLEPLTIANGVKTQTFPIREGSLLILPTTDFKDVRLQYSDNTEQRLDAEDLEIKAKATNGIICLKLDNTVRNTGMSLINIIDLLLEDKRVTEVEINLYDGLGYVMYKAVNLDKPGFDHRF